ncbi:MAG: hypothetical protein ACI9LO_000902 [Planctomycetota bacterium]|jgi:hypothetical protein
MQPYLPKKLKQGPMRLAIWLVAGLAIVLTVGVFI